MGKHPNALVCFLLIWFLGLFLLGSFIINAAGLNPPGWKSRTKAVFFLGWLTCGIYTLIVAICQFAFDDSKQSNIGYYRE
jgi:hypothetical protein